MENVITRICCTVQYCCAILEVPVAPFSSESVSRTTKLPVALYYKTLFSGPLSVFHMPLKSRHFEHTCTFVPAMASVPQSQKLLVIYKVHTSVKRFVRSVSLSCCLILCQAKTSLIGVGKASFKSSRICKVSSCCLHQYWGRLFVRCIGCLLLDLCELFFVYLYWKLCFKRAKPEKGQNRPCLRNQWNC